MPKGWDLEAEFDSTLFFEVFFEATSSPSRSSTMTSQSLSTGTIANSSLFPAALADRMALAMRRRLADPLELLDELETLLWLLRLLRLLLVVAPVPRVSSDASLPRRDLFAFDFREKVSPISWLQVSRDSSM